MNQTPPGPGRYAEAKAAPKPPPGPPRPRPSRPPPPPFSVINQLPLPPDLSSAVFTEPAAPAQPGSGFHHGSPLPEFVHNSLLQRGVDPDEFRWIMPATAMTLVGGRSLVGGFTAEGQDGKLHIIHFTQETGFHYATAPLEVVERQVQANGVTPVLRISLPDGWNPQEVLTEMGGQAPPLSACWLEYWQPALTRALGANRDAPLLAATITLQSPGEGCLCVSQSEPFVAFMALEQSRLHLFLDGEAVALGLLRWRLDGEILELLLEREGIPWAVSIHEVPVAGAALRLPSLVGKLPREMQAGTPLAATLDGLGSFRARVAGDDQARLTLLRDTGEGLAVASGPHRGLAYDRFYRFERYAVAASRHGPAIRLELSTAHGDDQEREPLSRFLVPAESLLFEEEDGGFWCPVLVGAREDPLPSRLRVERDSFAVGRHKRIPSRADDQILVEDLGGGWSRLLLRFGGQDGAQAETLWAPEALAYCVWEHWDMLRLEAGLATATVADLYKVYNEAKKLNLLVTLFSDIILLNRELNAGTDLAALLAEVDAQGEDAKPDQQLREALVSKILTLVVTLPSIKQKFEVLASLYPYYRVQQEMDWLREALGHQINDDEVRALRKQMVPRIRGDIRTIQTNISRSLMEMEAAARPLSGLLSKEKVQATPMARLGTHIPLALQGLFAVGMVAVNPANLMAWNTLLSGFLGSGVLRNVFTEISRDAERVSQVVRAARTLLPWWQIFMRTLDVTVFEAGLILDDENVAAMKRDRMMFDKLPPAERGRALERLSGHLRRSIVAERRNRFREVLSGTGIRTGTLLQGIEELLTVQINRDIDEFVRGLELQGRRLERDPGHDAV